MPSRALGSPVLMAFLRALAFVGITESIAYRLLPEPSARAQDGLFAYLHASLNRAGGFTFFLAFFLAAFALVNVGFRALRLRLWPAGLNGFLATCLLCVAALGFSTVAVARGPIFAIAFTALSLLTVLFIAMHAYAGPASAWARAFAVCYCGSMISSAAGTVARVAGTSAAWAGPLAERSVPAGEILFSASGALAFMAYHEMETGSRRASRHNAVAVGLGALVAAAFAAGALMVPAWLALLGPDPAPARVLMLSVGLFLATVTVVAGLLEPARRLRGYGLLVLLMAGFPLRIAYQHMLAVLGAALVFAPAPAETVALTLDRSARPGPEAPASPPPEEGPARKEPQDGAAPGAEAAEGILRG